MICIADHPGLVDFARTAEIACADAAADGALLLQKESALAREIDVHVGELLVDLFCSRLDHNFEKAASSPVAASTSGAERASICAAPVIMP